MLKKCRLHFLIFCALSADFVSGSEEGTAFFESKIRPILAEHCYDCHSEAEEEMKGGLLLDRESAWLEGGDSGKAVVPGNLEGSLLITAVRRIDEDDAMPPKYALSEKEVSLLEAWVEQGAPGPLEDMGETKFSQLGDQDVIFERSKDHWAFQPIKNPTPPAKGHPVDAFIREKLKENNLEPSPTASSRTLTRRLSYDLTGLPPTPGMFETAPEVLIDELIASPRFGEHFARMWLDVARYADTAQTYRADTRTPHYYPYAFTYRDYVIKAFNSDKPFGDFIREQLAADLMEYPEDAPELAALGFLGLSPHRTMSADFVDDVIDATTRGFIGLTVSCARCHDHKFEPVPTADYYSLYGVFASVDRPQPHEIDKFPKIAGYDPDQKLVADYLKKRAEADSKIEEAKIKKSNRNSEKFDAIRDTVLAELLLTHDGAPARAMAVTERAKPVNPFIFVRGESRSRGERVPRRFLKILDPEQQVFPAEASGRLEVAERIADPSNPLTARVFVNRVWGAIMGSHLVDTPSDFGLEGAAPSHPELLDWLASNFLKNDGSLKHLVRTIVTSETYQQKSLRRQDGELADPENGLYWRANSQRLQIEEIRDSLLAVSGQMDTRMFGRSAPLWDEEDYSSRRSIYGYINRFNLDPTLRSFDFPSPAQTQDKRTESIVSPQVLFTMNSTFVRDQSNQLLDRLDFKTDMNRPTRVNAVFQAVLNRDALEAEHERIGRFVDLESGRGVNPWPLLAQSLFMSNEFLYVD